MSKLISTFRHAKIKEFWQATLATGEAVEDVDVESEFSDLDLQLYSDLEEKSDEEFNEFRD